MPIIIIKSLIIGYFLSRFSPLQWAIKYLLKNGSGLLLELVTTALSCSKCLAFWTAIILYGNLWAAIIASILMTIYEKKLASWEKVKF